MNKKFKEDLKDSYRLRSSLLKLCPFIMVPLFIRARLIITLSYYEELGNDIVLAGIIVMVFGLLFIPFGIFGSKLYQKYLNKIDEEEKDEEKPEDKK